MHLSDTGRKATEGRWEGRGGGGGEEGGREVRGEEGEGGNAHSSNLFKLNEARVELSHG